MKQEKIELTYTFDIEEVYTIINSMTHKMGRDTLKGMRPNPMELCVVLELIESLDSSKMRFIQDILDNAYKEGHGNNPKEYDGEATNFFPENISDFQ